MLLDRAGACLVNLPDPARYGLHKLLVAAERGPRHAKYTKDISQALSLIDWHLERAPSVLRGAWGDLACRGSSWVKRAQQPLQAAPAAQRELVLRFRKAVGLK